MEMKQELKIAKEQFNHNQADRGQRSIKMIRVLSPGKNIQRKSNDWHSQLRGETANVPLTNRNLSGCVAGLHNIHDGIYGDCTSIYGDASNITGDVSNINGLVMNLSGDVSGLSGCVSQIIGDCTGIVGDVTELAGNLDGAGLSTAERVSTVGVDSLII